MATLHPRARILEEGEAQLWEHRIGGRPWQGPGTVVGISVPLSALTAVLSLAEQQAAQGSLFELSLRATIGVGEAHLRSDPEAVRETADSVEALGGRLEVHRGAPGLGSLGSTLKDPVGRQLMAAVKQDFDPGGILAPARFVREL